MSLWDRIKSILVSEASDVKEGLDHLGHTLDEELAKAERKQQATPAERVDIILDEIEHDDDALSQIEAQLSPEQAAGPNRRVRNAPSHRLLEPSDVSASPHLNDALGLVSVEFISATDGVGERFTHRITLDSTVEEKLGDGYNLIASQVAEHPLVTSSVHDTEQILLVDAPSLHVDDLSLLTAAAFADQLS